VSDLQADDVELRRAARERALELLYEAEAKGLPADEVVAGLPLAPAELALELVRGVEAHRERIDTLLTERVSPRWTLARLAAVDRAVLRLATYELLAAPDRSQALIINEAVILARRFGTDDSSRFVNGVLSAIAAEVRPSGAPAEPSPPAAPERERQVDAVIVDLDGVIRHWDEDAIPAMEEALGLPPGSVEAAAYDPAHFDPAMRGELSAEEWRTAIGEAVAKEHDADAAAVTAAFAEVGWRIDESVLELLDQVRATGVPVVLLSNASTALLDDLQVSGIDDRFDAVVGSAELGRCKPDAESYRAAAQRAGIAPERCLMIDDKAENVAGAEAVGMRGLLYEDVDTLERELRTLGLVPPV
jgi:putative hydrolase of the HAD superfamily